MGIVLFPGCRYVKLALFAQDRSFSKRVVDQGNTLIWISCYYLNFISEYSVHDAVMTRKWSIILCISDLIVVTYMTWLHVVIRIQYILHVITLLIVDSPLFQFCPRKITSPQRWCLVRIRTIVEFFWFSTWRTDVKPTFSMMRTW